MTEAQKTDGPSVEDRSSDPVPPDEEVVAKWPELASRFASQPRLASAIANAKLEMQEKDGLKVVKFLVVSEAQSNWIRGNMLSRMQDELRAILGTVKVGLDVDAVPQEEHAPVIYMDEDKARKLMADNPEVANLVKDLELDA